MTKTLNAISLDAPASPVSAAINDTFPFSGTPGFSGTGGVNRYDFRWEVNPGTGYVPIDNSTTGLRSASANPLANTSSATQNSITVSVNDPGSYTIRMAGAPTTGGSYTVFSATQTVTVAASTTANAGNAAATGSAPDPPGSLAAGAEAIASLLAAFDPTVDVVESGTGIVVRAWPAQAFGHI